MRVGTRLTGEAYRDAKDICLKYSEREFGYGNVQFMSSMLDDDGTWLCLCRATTNPGWENRKGPYGPRGGIVPERPHTFTWAMRLARCKVRMNVVQTLCNRPLASRVVVQLKVGERYVIDNAVPVMEYWRIKRGFDTDARKVQDQHRHGEAHRIRPVGRQTMGKPKALPVLAAVAECRTRQSAPTSEERYLLSLRSAMESMMSQIANQGIYRITHAYIEWPMLFQSSYGQTVAERGDLVKLAAATGWVAGCLAGLGGRVVPVTPNTWKGQLSKALVQRRIEKHYSHHRHPPRFGPDHVWDAVGIGLWAKGLRTFNQKGIVP